MSLTGLEGLSVGKINFQQCWSARKYFVVHVPKTGGTSLFNWLCRIYGTDRCRQHIESMVLPTPTAEAVDHLMGFDVIGGHVPIDYLMYFTGGDFSPITIIRNPSDQFFSHVNHILNVEVGEGLLRGIQDKARVSAGYLLENATPEELEFFESPQSKPVFGGAFNWRELTLQARIDWLQDTYAAVMTTETMAAAMSQMENGTADGLGEFPRLNTRSYQRERLTARQNDIMDGLLHEDRGLHQALLCRSA